MERHSASPMTRWWQRTCVYVAPAVLLGVAATQVYHVRANGLTAWRGGGFGMFSTVDGPSQRLLRAYLLVQGKEVPLTVPRDLARLNAAARILPTPDRLRALGSELLAVVRSSISETRQTPQKLAVRIEVWRLAFDASTSRLEPSKFREAVVEER